MSLLIDMSGHPSGVSQRRGKIAGHVRNLPVRALSIRPTSQTSNIGPSDSSDEEREDHILVLGERERKMIATLVRRLANLESVE